MEEVTLKLLVNRETNKVLFGVAGKDFVDLLCSFLTFPLGTIARLVRKTSDNIGPVTVGCLDSLYQSVDNLDKECLWTPTCKEMLLKPRNASENYCRSLKLNIDDTEPKKYFMCLKLVDSEHCSWLSTFKNQICGCGSPLSREVSIESDSVCNGFVKDGASFIITDDLIVKPNSMDTSFGMIQSFGITNTSSVREMTVYVTKEKVLDLLKCSLFSKSTLTDLFLKKKPFLQPASFSPFSVANNNACDFQIKVKLFLRKSDGKLLFAQGEEDFADFLFSSLTYPLGRVVYMIRGYCTLGSIDGLFKSITDLIGEKYFISTKGNNVKNRVVYPDLAPHFKLSKQILPTYTQPAKQYYCYYQSGGFRESIIQKKFSLSYYYKDCPIFSKQARTSLKNVDPKSSSGSNKESYVKGPAVFVATDDLVVTPMSPISAISLLNRLETSPTDVMENVVTIGYNEGCSILTAALTSTSALTNGLGHLLGEVKLEK